MNEQFIKIPKNIFSIHPRDAKLYAAYIDFKAFNPEGNILKSQQNKRKRDRHYYRYWANRLVEKGWATKTDNGIALKAYQHVWRSLDVERYWNQAIGRYKFAYVKISVEDLPLERKAYFRKIQDILLERVASNKVRQIKWRLNNRQAVVKSTNTTETFLSCKKVAQLFNLTSETSGSKYRKAFFELIDEQPKIIKKMRHNSDGTISQYYGYTCRRIAL
jgi:hypothetical protein